jgi:hypothetical protein
VTLKAYRHLGLSGPQRLSVPQTTLFEETEGDDGGQAGTA